MRIFLPLPFTFLTLLGKLGKFNKLCQISFRNDIAALRKDIAALRNHIAALRNDIAALKDIASLEMRLRLWKIVLR